MLKKSFFVVAFGSLLGCTLGHATSAPFCAIGTGACILSGYNLVALGYGTTAGNVIGPAGGNLGGRVAAASEILSGFTVGQRLSQTGTVNSNSMGGTVTVYNEKFTGTLLVPAAKSMARTPEPGSLLLLGSGLLVLAGLMRYRRNH